MADVDDGANPFGDSEVQVAAESSNDSLSSSTLAVGRNASLTLGTDSLIVLDEGFAAKQSRSCCGLFRKATTPTRAIRYYDILWADLTNSDLTIHYAAQVSKDVIRPSMIFYPVDKPDEHAREWTAKLVARAYGRAQVRKRIKVLVNPFGGKGSAVKYFQRDVDPIFAAARCEVQVEQTQYSGHAVTIARELDADAWDVVACCSGDGVAHEVFNGLGQKPDASVALAKVAVAHVPCGSGNAMSMNLAGTASPSRAALAVVKGIRTPMDLVSVTQGNRRTLSFLSQAVGIVAEVDLGTENLRWMGSARFTYGFFVRVVGKTIYPCDLAVGVEIGDKAEVREAYRRQANEKPSEDASRGPVEHSGLPPLRYGTVNDPLPSGWRMAPYDNLGNFYAGNMAWMTTDSNVFPASIPSDGCQDLICIDGDIPRITSIKAMLSVESGSLINMDVANYRKISGYRIIPKQPGGGYISIDGERVPFEPFQTEVHKGLATVLSKSGYLYEGSGVK